MDDALVVRGLERVDDLARDRERVVHVDRSAETSRSISWNTNPEVPAALFLRGGVALQPGVQRLSVDELEHQEFRRSRIFEAVNRRDTGMVERCEQLGLALEERDAFGISDEQLRQDLDRNVTTELRVARLVDLADPARSERREDLVSAEP
jgi:hypothetical protein